jgi:hypothetical protein
MILIPFFGVMFIGLLLCFVALARSALVSQTAQQGTRFSRASSSAPLADKSIPGIEPPHQNQVVRMVASALGMPLTLLHRGNVNTIARRITHAARKPDSPLGDRERSHWPELLLMAVLTIVSAAAMWYFVDHIVREVLMRIELTALGFPRCP